MEIKGEIEIRVNVFKRGFVFACVMSPDVTVATMIKSLQKIDALKRLDENMIICNRKLIQYHGLCTLLRDIPSMPGREDSNMLVLYCIPYAISNHAKYGFRIQQMRFWQVATEFVAMGAKKNMGYLCANIHLLNVLYGMYL